MMQKRFPVFAERFSQLRGEMTQGEFAEFLGISRPTVGFYENGTRIPDALVLRQIAEKCNVSSNWLLGLSSVRTPNADVSEQAAIIDRLTACPFCGGSASINEDPEAVKDTQGRRWAFTVVCDSCAASSGLCWSVIQAIDAWNMRTDKIDPARMAELPF